MNRETGEFNFVDVFARLDQIEQLIISTAIKDRTAGLITSADFEARLSDHLARHGRGDDIMLSELGIH